MKFKFFASMFMLSGSLLQAQTTQVINLSTGVLNSSGLNAPVGSIDDTWTVKIPGTSSFVNAGVSNNIGIYNMTTPLTFAFPNTDSLGGCGNAYISPFTVTTPGTAFGYINYNTSGFPNYIDYTPLGNYQYKMNFPKLNCVATSATLNLSACADNNLDSITINGHTYNLTAMGIGFMSSGVVSFNLTIPVSQLVAGTNTIIAHVYNNSIVTAVFMCGSLTINYANDPNLIPSIAGGTNFCAGAPLTFAGSDGVSTSNNYFWEIVEATNSSGTPAAGGFSWSSWYAGTPGTYTFPANPGIICGKYYRIKLAVQNDCVGWRETTKVIRINCLPSVNAGPDVTICSGSCVTLTSAAPGKLPIYEWFGPSGSMGFGTTTTVCPETTTTYISSVTNFSTGCVGTDAVTVNVINNSPSFNLYINAANPSYFTVEATANNTAAYSVPGFYYEFKIEELNTSGTPYYANTGTDAWWYFPMNDFKGFTSTPGSFSQINWWTYPHPPVGTFLYGHTYKITRTTWNQSCPQQSAYYIITPVRNMISGEITMTAVAQGEALPSGVELLSAIPDLSVDGAIYVYPNPGTGIFTVESTKSFELIEVYDALGKKVKTIPSSDSKSVIDLTDFNKGIYIIQVLSEGKLTSKKIILE